MTKQRWFVIKTLYRIATKGRPVNRDEFYQSGIASLEERLVIFTARNYDSAMKKGEAEAKKYAKAFQTTNKYGQMVVAEFTGFVESYEMFESPGNGVEIYSRIELVSSRTSLESLNRSKQSNQIDPCHTPQFIADFISEGLSSLLGPEWPRK